MKLYWGSGSSVSWRAQLALALKGLAYESHRLDLGQREHRSDAYLAINPRGTFPVLVDGAVTVRDSLAILAYLDRRDPRPPLFGESAAEAALIWQTVAEHDAAMGARANMITQALFRDGGLKDPKPVASAVDAVQSDLAELNDLVSGPRWIAGERPSAAEVVYYPTVHRLLRASRTSDAATVGLTLAPLKSHFPAVVTWLSRLAALPGVADTYPPHWRCQLRQRHDPEAHGAKCSE